MNFLNVLIKKLLVAGTNPGSLIAKLYLKKSLSYIGSNATVHFWHKVSEIEETKLVLEWVGIWAKPRILRIAGILDKSGSWNLAIEI